MIDLGYSLEADDTMAVRLHCSKDVEGETKKEKEEGQDENSRPSCYREIRDLGREGARCPCRDGNQAGQLGMQNARFGQRGHFAVVLDAPLRESVRQSHDNRGTSLSTL